MSKVTRELYKQLGMCQICGKEKPIAGITYCRVCKARKIEYDIATKSHLAEEQKAERREKKRKQLNEYRKTLRESGICIDCCKRKAKSNYVRCEICLAKDRVRHENKRRTDGYPSRQFIVESGICYHCCKLPALKDKKLCRSCYEKAVLSLEKAREYITSGWLYEDFKFGKYGKPRR